MPEILISHGGISASGCESLVSPVDCTGAMGAGLALELAQRHRKQAAWYREHARRGFAEPGQVYHVLPRDDGDRMSAARQVLEWHRRGGEPLVLFATTKLHWRSPSKLSWVAGCCDALVDAVNEIGVKSVAIPALGCGLGQRFIRPSDAFDWTDVRPLILAAAERMRCERVVVFEPR